VSLQRQINSRLWTILSVDHAEHCVVIGNGRKTRTCWPGPNCWEAGLVEVGNVVTFRAYAPGKAVGLGMVEISRRH
jgi:hypothetical protein